MLIRLVLAINDEKLETYLDRKLSPFDVRVERYGHLGDAWEQVLRSCGDVIVISEDLIQRPTDSGISFLNHLPENPTTVILHDSDSSEKTARLTAAGADVVLSTAISKKSLAEALETTLESRKQFIQKEWLGRKGLLTPKISDFVIESEVMRMFIDEVQQVILSDAPILLLGETGVGKEHLAKAIHAESQRSAGPFIMLNTAAVPEQLLESELFGHEQGAFTGATRYRRGAFELAHGGTIFLDEIGEMPLHLQAKLLHVLQDYEVRPVGGEDTIWVDVRVITASNRNLEKEITRKNFRKDLFYRLSVLVLTIPPLSKRREDIPGLARRFVSYYRHKIGREITRLSEDALQALYNYAWPGNVRELMNVIERAMLLCRNDIITLRDLPDAFHEEQEQIPPYGNFEPGTWINKTLPEVQRSVMNQVEKLYLEMVLKKTNGRVKPAAQMAGIHPRGLFNKMKRLGIRKEKFKNSRRS
ncbi:MAG TPA: sigma-54-dependent Fis family transcriptional regulator [Deltaproteobacteria bacterium]|nr:sigma-54-dependent Fis family transcriptional regulator [Deltaproteobacteria bacterium]